MEYNFKKGDKVKIVNLESDYFLSPDTEDLHRIAFILDIDNTSNTAYIEYTTSLKGMVQGDWVNYINIKKVGFRNIQKLIKRYTNNE